MEKKLCSTFTFSINFLVKKASVIKYEINREHQANSGYWDTIVYLRCANVFLEKIIEHVISIFKKWHQIKYFYSYKTQK